MRHGYVHIAVVQENEVRHGYINLAVAHLFWCATAKYIPVTHHVAFATAKYLPVAWQSVAQGAAPRLSIFGAPRVAFLC